MNNKDFLKIIQDSFVTFLNTHPRSNKKLKILHGSIAKDIEKKLGTKYAISSLGLGKGKEAKINGRYMDKTVDITIFKNGIDIAGIGVKFVMNNYSQNSNNYFENMLGETANIRANKKKYFQILILPDEMPYYNKNGKIKKWENITNHNVDKYLKLSKDDEDLFFHTPIKLLIFNVKFPNLNKNFITTRAQYKKYYLGMKNVQIKLSKNIVENFGERVVLNDYESFIKKIVFYLKSI
jgi:hypothetical protein